VCDLRLRRGHDGCTMKKLLSNVETHYASTKSAQGSLVKWIRTGYIKGLRLKRDGKKLRIYLEEKNGGDEHNGHT
jgi:hypothetical protein